MLKNNLKQIMEDRKLSQNGLAKKTGISRQVIINAVKNPFHVMDSNILTALLMELNMTLEEFGTLYTPKQYLDEMLKVIGFTTNNLDLLSRLVKEKTNFQLKYEPYSSNRTINFRIHKNSRIDFSGNVRAKSTWEGLVFEVIDFDLYPKKDGSFTKKTYC